MLRLKFKVSLSSTQKNLFKNTLEIPVYSAKSPKITTESTNMRSERKARISGLAGAEHARKSNFTRSHISSDRVRSGYEIRLNEPRQRELDDLMHPIRSKRRDCLQTVGMSWLDTGLSSPVTKQVKLVSANEAGRSEIIELKKFLHSQKETSSIEWRRRAPSRRSLF